MRKRKYVIGALAVAVAAVIPASASAAITSQTVTVAASPTKVTKKKSANKGKYPTPVALTVGTHAVYSAVTPSPPNPTPVATLVNIDFDKDFTFTTKGIATCNPTALTGTTTAAAQAVCGASQVGTGSANLVGVAGPATAVVTAFNGTPVNGQPQLLLHTRVGAPLNTTAILPGVLQKSPVAGFGTRLVVTVPPLAGGYEALTDFVTTVDKRFKVKKKVHGKTKKIKSGYVTATCANKSWDVQGVFNYSTFPPAAPASSSLSPTATAACKGK
jgi:hypothetical protein